jgi:serine/threonine-protein kinase
MMSIGEGQTMSHGRAELVGMLLGNYRVVEQLGEGGMGVVYIGRHETLGHRVVVKVLLPECSRDPDMVQRFFNEAQAATAIRNPGIAQVFDVGTTAEGQGYIVMELLEGQSLAARLQQRKLDYTACCRIGRQIANVLQAAHDAGITHRDLKPDNLFLVPDAEVIGGERVKVLDFGIAKLSGEGQAEMTRTGMVMGSPGYMAPEQCRSIRMADARSDIYPLGCILYEMACGRAPFVGENPMEIVSAHLQVMPPHPHNLAPDLPYELSALIAKMLSKHPDARPQTMTAVGHALDGALRTLGEARARTQAPTLPWVLPIWHARPRFPVPRLSPFAKTLGNLVRMASTPMRVAARRRPFLLGALVIVGAIVAIALALAFAGGSDASEQTSPERTTELQPVNTARGDVSAWGRANTGAFRRAIDAVRARTGRQARDE